jgi:hypothetical protein
MSPPISDEHGGRAADAGGLDGLDQRAHAAMVNEYINGPAPSAYKISANRY